MHGLKLDYLMTMIGPIIHNYIFPFSLLSRTSYNEEKRMNTVFTVTILAILVCYMYAAPRAGNENEMQKVIEQAMESEEVQAALKQALMQGSIQDEDDSPADLASLQSMLANMEQNEGDDENTKAQLIKLMADIQTPGTTAHAQWKWWKKHRIGHKIWRGVKKTVSWIGR